jgi:hypothetical protein
VHTGETELIERKRGGMTVVIGARVMALAQAGEVLVTSTTRDLVTGSTVGFESRGEHELKGVPGSWQVLRVTSVDGVALGDPLTADEAIQRSEAVHATSARRRGRRVAAVASAAVLLITGGVVAYKVTATDPVTVFAVNAKTNVVGPVLRDGEQSLHHPNSIYYDGSSIWQAVPSNDGAQDGTLLRRDPSDGSIQSSQDVPTGDGMGFGFGYAWTGIGGRSQSQLLKIDPPSGRTVATITLPGTMVDAESDSHSIWSLSHQGDLAQIDPTTAKILATYRVPAGDPSRVVPLVGSIWVCDCPNGKILKVDPSNGTVDRTVALQQHGYLIGADSRHGKTLWLVDPDAGTITPLDARTGRPGRPLGFGGSRVYDTEIGFGSIWVAAGSHLFRFDLSDDSKHEIAVPDGASAGGLAMDPRDKTVWVENCGCPDT